nr:hypothetical protein Iba_chr05eCG10730 [Ipomoea batatas]GME06780.1 hypothetical protein Iba_scaffold4978CG1080 [Ipomoea batatas]
MYASIFLARKVKREIKELSSTSDQIQRAFRVEWQFVMALYLLWLQIIDRSKKISIAAAAKAHQE